MLEQMAKVKQPVILVGESGTSKTATTQNFLKSLNEDTNVSHSLYPLSVASSQITPTRSSSVQETLPVSQFLWSRICEWLSWVVLAQVLSGDCSQVVGQDCSHQRLDCG